MSKELAVRYDDLVIPPEEAILHFKKIQELKKRILDKTDYAIIQNKPRVTRSGWQKFAWAFGLSDEIILERREDYDKYFVQRIWVKVINKNGRYATGDGSCASNERQFAHVEHDVYSTAHTRGLNRAISNFVGLGEVSADEIDVDYPSNSTPQAIQSQGDEVYCGCTIPQFNPNGVCKFCGKLSKKVVEAQKARLNK